MIIIIICNHEQTTSPLYRTFRLNAVDKTGHNACFTTTREGGSAGSDGITAGAAEVKQRGAI